MVWVIYVCYETLFVPVHIGYSPGSFGPPNEETYLQGSWYMSMGPPLTESGSWDKALSEYNIASFWEGCWYHVSCVYSGFPWRWYPKTQLAPQKTFFLRTPHSSNENQLNQFKPFWFGEDWKKAIYCNLPKTSITPETLCEASWQVLC